MSQRCRVCDSPMNGTDRFCQSCGAPSRAGVRLINSIERVQMILLQLERSYQAGQIKKEKYDEVKADYTQRLAELQGVYQSAQPVSAAPPPAGVSAPPPDNVNGAKNAVIYADPPHQGLLGGLAITVGACVLAAAAFYIAFHLVGGGLENVWIQKWYLTAFSLSGPAIYMVWMWRTDKLEREPWYLIALIIGWGAFSAFLSYIGNTTFSSFGIDAPWLVAPLVEETLKALGVFWIAKNPEFNNPLDGMVYGFAAGMGFAWVENLFYITYMYEGNVLLSVLRVFVFGLGHGIYTAYTGRALGQAKIKKGYVKFSDMYPGLALAMLAHGIYNSDILQISGLEGLAIWVTLTIGSYLVILAFFIRQAQKQERDWRYDQGIGPDGNPVTPSGPG